MHIRTIYLGFLVVGLMSESSFAQAYAGFQSLLYPRSITSSALGEQGVASRSALDAMQYNPANLAYAEGVSFSFFRNPWNILGFASFPMTTFTLTGRLSKSGAIGVEYLYHDYGESTFSTDGNPEGVRFHSYQRSVAGGYAMSLSDQVAIGVQLRYVWQGWPNWGNPSQPIKIDKFLFGSGVSYKPEMFSDRLVAGLSLMNFGTRIEYRYQGEHGEVVQYNSPPAQLNLGLQGWAVTNDFFEITAALSATKPFDETTGPPDYAGQSSFKLLFNDWDDFPNDVTAHVGLGFLWHPIHLGAGISVFQEIYVGYFSTGPNDIYKSFYTHGVKVGLKGYGVQATAGYADWWHNNDPVHWAPLYFPRETFQFTLSTDGSMFAVGMKETSVERVLNGIIVSAGYSYGLPVGRMREASIGRDKFSYLNNSLWSVEADFYINENSAILSSFSYSRLTGRLAIRSYQNPLALPWTIDAGIETVSFESGFRYHPLEAFHPLFVQVSLGVIRLNPVYERTYPRYMYKSYDEVALGCVVPVMEDVILKPKVGLKTLFMEVGSLGRIGGYNQFEFGVNVGYRL